MNIMADEGMTFYLNSSATGVKEEGAGKEVLLKNSQGEIFPLRAEVILVAVGRSANTNSSASFGPQLPAEYSGKFIAGMLSQRSIMGSTYFNQSVLYSPKTPRSECGFFQGSITNQITLASLNLRATEFMQYLL